MELWQPILSLAKIMTDLNMIMSALLRLYLIIPCLALLGRLGKSDISVVALLAPSNVGSEARL
jgi:hypothetical protein